MAESLIGGSEPESDGYLYEIRPLLDRLSENNEQVGPSLITLRDNEFSLHGGEGQVAIAGGMAYKRFFRKDHAPDIERLKNLAHLSCCHDRILSPVGSLHRASDGTLVGYCMNTPGEPTVPMRSLFASDTRPAPWHALYGIAECLWGIHWVGALAQDINDGNFLASADGRRVWAVDTNSYIVKGDLKGFTAGHISFQDPRIFAPSEASDNFSFAILAFLMLTGEHPYAGKCQGFEHIPNRWQVYTRMKHGVSFFHRYSHQNASVRSRVEALPREWQDWMEASFGEKPCHQTIPFFPHIVAGKDPYSFYATNS